MTELAGYGGKVEFPNVIGAAEACANAWSMDVNIDTHDVTDFCSTSAWRDFITGLKGWTVSVDLKIDGAKPINATDLGASATLQLYIDGTQYYSGTALLSGFSPSVSVDAEETQAVTFQGTGLLSFT